MSVTEMTAFSVKAGFRVELGQSPISKYVSHRKMEKCGQNQFFFKVNTVLSVRKKFPNRYQQGRFGPTK